MLERRRGTQAELAFLADARASRFRLVDDLEPDLDRITELVERCAELPQGTDDASVVVLTERLGAGAGQQAGCCVAPHRLGDGTVSRPAARPRSAGGTW